MPIRMSHTHVSYTCRTYTRWRLRRQLGGRRWPMRGTKARLARRLNRRRERRRARAADRRRERRRRRRHVRRCVRWYLARQDRRHGARLWRRQHLFRAPYKWRHTSHYESTTIVEYEYSDCMYGYDLYRVGLLVMACIVMNYIVMAYIAMVYI